MATYKLNIIPGDAPVIVPVNQYEYGFVINFEIYDGATAFDITGMTSIFVDLIKPDRNIYSTGAVEVVGTNTARVSIQQQMTAMWGPCIAELVFEKGSSSKRCTANFILDVEKCPIEGGADSETVVNYVEANREAAEAATAAANAAATAANAAADAASGAAETAANAIANIEAMPGVLQSLASALTITGASESIVGFNHSGEAAVFDVGFVTPQMYGAKGNGTANDTSAFQAALASGKKVVVPSGNYKLNSILWSDDSIVISDAGTYPNKPLIISRNLRESAPVLRIVKEFNASPINGTQYSDYRVQTGCYDPVNERIVLAFCYKNENSSDTNFTSDLVLTAFDLDWNPIPGMSVLIEKAGHGNSVVYAPDVDDPTENKIYVIVGNRDLSDSSVGQIAVINPDDLSFEKFISPVTESNRTWGMAYDTDNKIFYLQYTAAGGVSMYRAFDAEFTPLNKTFSMGLSDVQGIGKLYFNTEEFNSQGPIVIDGQLLQVMYGSKYGDGTAANSHADGLWQNNGGYLAQYNYHDGTIKKAYRLTAPYPGDEPQCIIAVEGRYYFISDSSLRNGFRNVSVSQLVLDDRLVGESESPYTDAKKLSSTSLPRDLNSILTVGVYVQTSERSASTETFSNAPTYQAFTLYVLPMMVRDARMQICVSSHGEVYVRAYIPSRSGTNKWYGWRQLAETPRSGGSRSGWWYGSGYITGGGKEIRFTIPLVTQTVGASSLAVNVSQLTINARQNGNYLIDNVDVASASGYTVTATMGAWGINIVILAESALTGAVNNDSVGIQANIALAYV